MAEGSAYTLKQRRQIISDVWNNRFGNHLHQEATVIHRKFNKKLDKFKDSSSLFGSGWKGMSNLERVVHVSNIMNDWAMDIWSTLNISLATAYGKSMEASQDFRQRANKSYKDQAFLSALEGYNYSLLFALPESPDLSLSYANRSAVFFQTKKYASCLLDISRALDHGYPENLVSKVLERQLKCCQQLNLDHSQSYWQNLKFLRELITKTETLESDERNLRKEFCDELFKLKHQNPYVTAAEDFIWIKYSVERGRHVVTQKFVKPGTVVIVDDPFAKILVNELKWETRHCHHCHARTKSGIPCPSCAFTFYCSEECLLDASEGSHNYECPCTPYFHVLMLPRNFLLAVRVITTLGPEAIKRLCDERQRHETQQQVQDSEARITGTENEIYRSDSYVPIYNLISHPDQCEQFELVSYTITALTISTILDHCTNFFDSMSESKYKHFVASLLLLHFQNLPCNAHSLYNLGTKTGEFKDWIRTATAEEYGAGAFALLSLINHSCDPNVFRINLRSGKTAVITLKHLKPGEELLDNYGHHYALEDYEERQKGLYLNYYFKCACPPCTSPLKWPLISNLKSIPGFFICQYCDGKPSLNATTDGNLICPGCASNYSHENLIESLNKKTDAFLLAHEHLLSNEPLNALPLLVQCLDYFGSNIKIPFYRINDAEETFKQALHLVNSWNEEFEVE